MYLPKKFYRVALKGAKNMRYAERGGTTYAILGHAQNHATALRKRHPEALVKIYECNPEWIEVASYGEKNEG